MTTIHKLHPVASYCSLCGVPIFEEIPHTQNGEYVGCHTTAAMHHEDPSWYRIGSQNRDRLCNGDDHSKFSQDSLMPVTAQQSALL